MTTTYNDPKYQIESSDFRCHACGGEIPCEARYYSAVSYEQETFRRRDYCVPCWKANGPRQPPQAPDPSGVREPAEPVLAQLGSETEIFAFWRARRPPLPADKPKRLRFDSELVLEFFRRLDGEASVKAQTEPVPQADGQATAASSSSPSSSSPSSSEKDDLRFVLSLLLLRKKTLQYLSSQDRGGVEWLKLSEKKESARQYWVRNPNLSDSQLEKMKDRVGELLQMRI